MSAQAPPQQAPSSAQVTLGALAVVLAADVAPATRASLALPLLAELGIAPAAALKALALLVPSAPTLAAVAKGSPLAPGQPLGDALRQVTAAEPVLRATYLVNAARRAHAGEATPAQERAYLARHLAATHARARAALEVDRAAREHGPELGWHALLDSQTTPECRAAHGSNFNAARPPKIGYPGTLHGGTCRCRPGAPFREALATDEAVATNLPRITGAHDVAFSTAYDDVEAIDLAFDPSEARDRRGRWTRIFGGLRGRSQKPHAASAVARAARASAPSPNLPAPIVQEWALGPTLRGRRILGGHDQTIDQHASTHDVQVAGETVSSHARRADAELVAKATPGAKVVTRWSRARARLHQEILRKFLDGNFVEQADGSFAWEHAPHRPQAHPVLLSTAGGPASGKSRMLASRPQLIPADAVTINPDIVKSQLPEYQRLLETEDPYAAGAVHEESSYLAAALTQVVAERGYNAVLDVVGDSGEGKFVQKLRAFARAGYRVRVAYATVPTELALERARSRERRTGRRVDPQLLQDAHRAVSGRFPEVVQESWIDHVEVWDNSGDMPKLIAEGPGGRGVAGLSVKDRALLERFLAKQQERGYQ